MQPSDPYGPGQPGQPNLPPAQSPSPYVPPQAQPPVQPQPGQTPPPQHDYSFIMSPEKPLHRPLLPGGNSMLTRILLVVGSLIVLIIVFAVGKSLLSGGSALPEFVSIAQSQQELIHLTTNASQEEDLSEPNQNFAITAQLSLTSDQSAVITYLNDNGTKLKDKQLNLKISADADKQLTDAATTNTYNETFKTIMQSKLAEYQNLLKQTYANKKTGPKGKELINKDFSASALLVQQLNADATQ